MENSKVLELLTEVSALRKLADEQAEALEKAQKRVAELEQMVMNELEIIADIDEWGSERLAEVNDLQRQLYDLTGVEVMVGESREARAKFEQLSPMEKEMAVSKCHALAPDPKP